MAVRSLDNLFRVFSTLKKDRQLYEDAWQDQADLMQPWRGDIVLERAEGESRAEGLFDTTALRASNMFASFLKNQIAPSSSKWVHLLPPSQYLSDDRARQQMDDTSSRVVEALYDSNFDIALGQAIRDLAIHSNSCLTVEHKPFKRRMPGDGFDGLTFKAHAVGTFYWKMADDGLPLVVCREFMMTPFDAVEVFEGGLPEEILKKVGTQDEFEKEKFLQFVYYNRDGSKGGKGGKAKWVSQYVAMNSTYGGGFLPVGDVGGFDICPFICSRYMVMDGEQYGRGGPGDVSRPDALTLNEAMRKILEAADMDMDPPLVVEEENATGLDWGPGGTIVLTPGVTRPPQWLNTGTRYDVAYQIFSELRGQVSSAFMEEQIIGKETQPRSAQESVLEFERSMSQLAIPASRLEHELLAPVVRATMYTMKEEGALPELEELEARIGGTVSARPFFVSPLFNALRQERVRRVRQEIAAKAELVNLTGDPGYLADISPARVNEFVRENNAQPAEIYYTEQEQQAIQRAAQLQAQEDRNLAQAQVGAEVIQRTQAATQGGQ